MQSRSERLELIAFYGALCLILSTLEYLIPKPIPFMRVGLANLPILLALRAFDAPTVLLLVALKVLGQGLVGGTLFSYVFLFSAAGSLAAGLTMMAASRLGGARISLVGISTFGALASNSTQILLAVALVFGPSGWLIGPPFLALGTVSGVALGLFAQSFERTSTWVRGVPTELPSVDRAAPGPPRRRARRAPLAVILSPSDAFVAGILMLVPFVFLERLEIRAALTAVFVTLSLLAGRRFRPLLPLMATAGIVAAHLLAPSGRVIWSAGPVSITSGALEIGARKSLTFVGLIYLSLFAVRPGLPLPGRLGGLLARVVYYFERLLEADKRLDRRDLMGSLDRFLWSVAPPVKAVPAATAETLAGPPRNPAPRLALLAALPLLAWGALALDLLLRSARG